jgi:hypothetical protein
MGGWEGKYLKIDLEKRFLRFLTGRLSEDK